MTFTITILQLCIALTVIVWAWALFWPSRYSGGGGWDIDLTPLFRLTIAVIATPTIWFFWALLRKG